MAADGLATRQVFRSVTGALLSSQAQAVTVQSRPLVVGAVRAAGRAHDDERRFADLFRSFPVGVAMLTDEGFFLEVNDALCALLGYRRDDLVGTSYLRLVHPDEVGEAQEARRAIAGTTYPLVRTERRLLRRDGTVVWALVNTRRYEEDGATFSVAAVEDITARKEAEDQLVVLALHDSLTGLPNRRLLLDRLEQALARSRARRPGRRGAVRRPRPRQARQRRARPRGRRRAAHRRREEPAVGRPPHRHRGPARRGRVRRSSANGPAAGPSSRCWPGGCWRRCASR